MDYTSKMSSSQYLNPDLYQPLPTTLDAKKSPLALLAQTCSSIGKDPTPSKSIIPPLGKKENKDSTEKLSSPDHKRPTSNGSNKSSHGRDSSDKPGFRTISSKEIPPLVPIASASNEKSKSPVIDTHTKTSDAASLSRNSPNTPVSSAASAKSQSSTVSSRSKSPSREAEVRDSSSSAQKSSARASPELSALKSSSHPSISSFPGLAGLPPGYPAFPFMGHGLPGDLPSSAAYPLSLAAHSGLSYSSSSAAAAMAAAQSSAALKHASSLSPYVTYARVRTPSGSYTLVPVCRDPYCASCQLTVQTQHLSSQCNTPGCAQCAHEKSLQSMCGLGLPGTLPMLPGLSSAGLTGMTPFPSPLASLYPPSALSSHQGLPFVCNWVSAGNEYCGKRFTSSEELLQHLRTHTAASDTAALSAFSGLSGLSPALHPGHLPTPGGLSPNSLRRTYPTSLSPVGGLLGASRYHPYKSSVMSGPSPLPSGQPLSTLGPYYSPYALYGQRLGAAAVP
ncbi:hypothetical protein FSP39_015948 [Pinctada imbricata]|uniref:C2H2-type domain-containing protein n=1 Tax=Pinctada imbricata TaxID=66713 RepID=A0AA88YDF4_PINIB|nr:hypothetical protein FSP39_015948 [Pinctada imbricata]